MNPFRPAPSAIPALAEARRRRWQWVIATLVFLALALAAARPIYRRGKAWRARGLASVAEQFIAEKKWSEAAQKASAAYQLAPEVPETLRAVARLYSRTGAPAALGYWKALLALPEATPEDRREAVAAALGAQQMDLASAQMTLLLQSEPVSIETLELAIRWAGLRQDREVALGFIERLLRLQPGHAGALLARAQLLFSDPATHAAGRQALQQIAALRSAEALAALRLLATETDRSPNDLELLAAAFESHPLAGPGERLAAVTLRLRAAPERRDALLTETAERFRSGPPETQAALGRWLLQQGEPQRVLDAIPAAAALPERALFLLRTDALAALGRWAEIRAALEQKDAPVEPLHREIFLARAATELKEETRADAHWSQAFVLGNQRPDQLLYLAQYAAKLGDTERAEKAWRQLTRHPRFALPAWLALLPIVEAQGNTRLLRDVLRQIVRLAPTDPAPRNDAAYLDLLLGENVASARQTAEQLVRGHPTILAYRTTLALAHLRARDPAGALRVYEGLRIDWASSLPSAKLIYLAALQANAKADETLARTLPVEKLKPEERALFSPAPSQKPALLLRD